MLDSKNTKCFEADLGFYARYSKFKTESDNEKKTMKCVICRGDEIKVMEVKEEFAVANDIVYVQVKVPVCRNCGERYYDRRTMQFLEEMEQTLLKKRDGLKEIGKVLMYE